MKMADIIRGGVRLTQWHYSLSEAEWRALAQAQPPWFLSHWCDTERAYLLFLDQQRPLLASTPLIERCYFALSKTLPSASWPERFAQDLWGTHPLDAAEDDTGINHDWWSHTWPLGNCVPFDHNVRTPQVPEPRLDLASPLAFSHGKLVLGFSHQGLLQRLIGLELPAALHLLSRVSYGETVGAPLAFCRAVEDALGIVPGRSLQIARAILSEIERIGVHLHDSALTAHQLGAELLATHAELAEHAVSQLCAAFGVRQRLVDSLTLEGVSPRIALDKLASSLAPILRARLSRLCELFERDRAKFEGRACLPVSTVEKYAIGGIVGRAAGRTFDLRRGEAAFRSASFPEDFAFSGDAYARQYLRFQEIASSLERMTTLASSERPAGEESHPPVRLSGEGIGGIEGARGDLWCWLNVYEGRIQKIHLRPYASSLLGPMTRLLQSDKKLAFTLASFGFSSASAEL